MWVAANHLTRRGSFMALVLLVVLLVLLFGGLGAGIQLLWWLAIIGLVFWVAGFAFRSGEGRRSHL